MESFPIHKLILESPTRRHMLVTYTVIVFVLVLIGGYGCFLAPAGLPQLIGAIVLFCAAIFAWFACTYKRSFIYEIDGCLVFVRGGQAYRRIVLADIAGARRCNESIHIDIQPRTAPLETKPEIVIFREDEMSDYQSGEVLWKYLGTVMRQESVDTFVYVRGT